MDSLLSEVPLMPTHLPTMGDVHWIFWYQGQTGLSDADLETLANQYGIPLSWAHTTDQQRRKSLRGCLKALVAILETRRQAIALGELKPGQPARTPAAASPRDGWYRLPGFMPIYAKRR